MGRFATPEWTPIKRCFTGFCLWVITLPVALGGELVGREALPSPVSQKSIPALRLAPPLVDLEQGRPFVHEYEPREYRAYDQNWVILQDKEGVMYFGNKNVVLAFDGASWHKIPVQNGLFIRGLGIDSEDTIYVGGVSQLGKLDRAPDGRRIFHSLLDRIPPENRLFGAIRKVFVMSNDEVVFCADKQIMFWKTNHFAIFKLSDEDPIQAYRIGETLFIQNKKIGLRVLREDLTPRQVENPIFHSAEIVLLLPYNENDLLVGTSRGELYLWKEWASSGDTAVLASFRTESDEFLAKAGLQSGLRLADGRLALATSDKGLLILNSFGQFINRIDDRSGLQQDRINSLFLDREAGLWLALYSGIAKAEFQTGLSIFDYLRGLPHDAVLDVIRYKGQLFAATGAGLYRLKPPDHDQAEPSRFERVADLKDVFSSLAIGPDGLLVAGSSGVFRYVPEDLASNGPRLEQIVKSNVSRILVSSADPNLLYVGEGRTIRFFYRGADRNTWEELSSAPVLAGEVTSLAEVPQFHELWAGTPIGGVIRLTLPSISDLISGVQPRQQWLSESAGLPKEKSSTQVVYLQAGDVLLVTQQGLYEPTEERTNFRAASRYGSDLISENLEIADLTEDAKRNLWIARRPRQNGWGRQEIGCANPSSIDTKWSLLPNQIADKLGQIETIYSEPRAGSGRDLRPFLWLGGKDGIIRVDSAHRSTPGTFKTFITRVTDRKGDPVSLTTASGLEIPFENNSISFSFGTDRFSIGSDPQFRIRLLGSTNAWSESSPSASIRFDNLIEGSYKLQVQALDADGQQGSIASFAFGVRPPWYRTTATQIGYLLAGLLIISGIVFSRNYRLRTEKIRLETIVSDRTKELREKQESLALARDEANSASRAKSTFLASMSHELRTPLNAILGFARLMQRDESLNAQHQRWAEIINHSGEHLLTLISELLDLTKIEQGRASLQIEPVLLNLFASEMVNFLRQSALEKNIDFRFSNQLDSNSTVIRTDAAKLRQILFNLLSNAIKYTPANGRVGFTVKPGSKSNLIQFEVEDDGPGIANADIENIFQPFFRVATSDNPGTGLGLSISKRLAQLLDGSLEVESYPGQGSRFWLELPVSKIETTLSEKPLVGSPSPKKVVNYLGQRRNILVVDDDAINRLALKELLVSIGFMVTESSSGLEAIEVIKASTNEGRPFDAVLLDLYMAQATGIETLAQIKSLYPARDEPVCIAVSACVLDSDQKEALLAGFAGFIAKPIQEDKLWSELGSALKITWVYQPAPNVEEPSSNGHSDQPFDPIEIDRLIESANQGDIVSLHRKLDSLAPTSVRYAALKAELTESLAGYQMSKIRKILRTWKDQTA